MLYFEWKRLLQNKALLGLVLLLAVITVIFASLYSHEAEIDRLQQIFAVAGTTHNDEYKQAVRDFPVSQEDGLLYDLHKRLLQELDADRSFFETYDASEIYNQIEQLRDGSGRKISPFALELMKYKYAVLDACVGELAVDGSATDVYFDVATSGIHNDIFVHFGTVLLIECCIFAVLCALTVLDEDKRTQTQLLVCSTKTGRKIQMYKVIAAVFVSSVVFVFLFLLGYGLVFLQNDFSGIWQQSVSSVNNLCITYEAYGPFVSWGSMTVGEYFVAGVVISYFVMLSFLFFASVFGCLGFSFLPTAGVFLGIQAALLTMIVFYIPGVSSFAFYLLRMTGVGLVYYRGLWFSEGGFLTAVPYYETVTTVLRVVVSFVCLLLSHRIFKRKSLA